MEVRTKREPRKRGEKRRGEERRGEEERARTRLASVLVYDDDI
jgi:hypothetical protein